jgi:DNA-binding XRE family transcriptional regulator
VKEQDAKAANAHQVVLYVERDDASYGPVQTGSYLAQEFIDDFFEKREHYRLDCLKRLEAGEVSAVWFYLQILGLSEADLAARVGVSRRAVRRHLTPAGFGEIDLRLVARYAEVFGVPVANLFQVIAAQDGRVELRQERTANPLLTKTRVGIVAPGAGDAGDGGTEAGR